MATVRVLLVDDHGMFTQSVMRVLAEEPEIEVLAAVGTAAATLEASRRTNPDVVVMDYLLPDGDGISLAGRLLDESPGTKVLLLTGMTDERLLVRAIDSGCAGFLTKDRAVDELVTAINAVADGDTWVPPSLITHLLPGLRRTNHHTRTELTPREIEVLQLAAGGLSNAAIAEELYLSVNTIRNHVQNAIAKLAAHSKLEAVAVAVREGIIAYPRG